MREWRCGAWGCVVGPLLGMVDDQDRVHVRLSGRTRYPRAVVVLAGGTVLAHCPSCHHWRALPARVPRVAHAWTGAGPDIGCAGCARRDGRAAVAETQ